MTIPQNISDLKTNGEFRPNLFYLFLIISIIGLITRAFLSHAVLILANSEFLFRFLLGALVILTTRYLLGIRTYGFFAPMVLVIAWMQITPLWATLVFLSIFTVSYIVRILIEPFNFAHGFRLGILMIVVIGLLGMYEVLGETFLIPFLSTTILLPIIITPSMVDHYVRDVMEKSHLEAFLTLVKTFLVTSLAYLFMIWDQLVQFIVLNPETWVVLAAIMIIIGKSGRYSLFDKRRFERLFKKGSDPLTLLVRNRDYIARYNPAILFPVITKYDMKEQFETWGVPTPRTLAVVSSEHEIDALMKRLMNEQVFANGFVIKPTRSFGGMGIVVVNRRIDPTTFEISGLKFDAIAIKKHITRIIQGEFLTSQTSTPNDTVIIEEKIECYKPLQEISVGLPDIRVIIFRGVAVMAMARLPTKQSQGKANLKQGAIGAAINLSTGVIFRAEFKGNPITKHPDTGKVIVGFKFENWKTILATACLAQKSSGLGYAGVDVVLDKNGNPLVLEINKRPGLEIQNINLASLLERMKYLEENEIDETYSSPLRSAQRSMELHETVWTRLEKQSLKNESKEEGK